MWFSLVINHATGHVEKYVVFHNPGNYYCFRLGKLGGVFDPKGPKTEAQFEEWMQELEWQRPLRIKSIVRKEIA